MSDYLYPTNPDRNVPWNGLPDLPVASELYRTVEVYEHLGRAKESLALLAGRCSAILNPSVLVNGLTLHEAKESSAIENIFTTDDELYEAFGENKREENVSGATKEVLRYREALWGGYQHLREAGEFDISYFVELHRTVKQTDEGVRPPHSQIFIRQSGSGPNAGKPVYTPPRGEGIVEAKLNALCRFLNDESVHPFEPILKMAMAHLQFEAIHPFRDGNGRVGRILNIHFLTKSGLLDLPVLYLSRFIHEHKSEYYEVLAGVTQRGDWSSWLIYMLRSVEETARLTFRKVNDIISAHEALVGSIVSMTEIRRPEQLADAIFTQPYTKVSHLTEQGLFAENTARSYLNRLASMRLVEKRSILGRHYYLNRELMDILAY